MNIQTTICPASNSLISRTTTVGYSSPQQARPETVTEYFVIASMRKTVRKNIKDSSVYNTALLWMNPERQVPKENCSLKK